MRSLTLFVIVVASFFASVGISEAEEAARPNIVLIFIDDMGWKDAGFQGSDFYQTPNINRLAKEGMVFTNAYAAAGNCAPSRACMISGQYTPRHHVYAVGSTNRGPKKEMRLKPTPNVQELAAEQVTIAEGMKLAGYRTGMFGKWHLGDESPFRPDDQGFDVADLTHPPKPKEFKETDDPKWIYRITKGACDFMDDCLTNHKGTPFFLYVPHHATHMPIQAREAMEKKMAGQAEGEYQKNKKYGAMNAQMDDGVGILLEKIKSLGIEEKTLVIFTSDNGALPVSPPTPLRGFKGMYYEGGVRVPMIARWPGVIEAGTTCDVPVMNIDFYPTFLELAGHKVPFNKTLDGASLKPLFEGETAVTTRPLFWFFPGYLDNSNPGAKNDIFRTPPVTTIRKGPWKLHLFHEEWILDDHQDKTSPWKSIELYNLDEDISESENVAMEKPEVALELLEEVLSWHEKVGAKLPTVKDGEN